MDSETIFDLIAAADDDGVYRFRYPKYLQDLLPMGKVEALRQMMESHFRELQLMDIRFSRGTKWIADFEAQAVRGSDEQ